MCDVCQESRDLIMLGSTFNKQPNTEKYSPPPPPLPTPLLPPHHNSLDVDDKSDKDHNKDHKDNEDKARQRPWGWRIWW